MLLCQETNGIICLLKLPTLELIVVKGGCSVDGSSPRIFLGLKQIVARKA